MSNELSTVLYGSTALIGGVTRQNHPENITTRTAISSGTPVSRLYNNTNITTDTYNLADDDVDTGFNMYIYAGSIDTIAILGILGNISLICVMVRTNASHLSYPVYLICVAPLDMLILVDNALADTLDLYDKLHEWFYTQTQFICKFWHFIYGGSVYASHIFTVMLTVDRFLIVTFPFHRSSLCNRKVACWLSAVILIISFSICVPELTYMDILKDGYKLRCKSTSEKYLTIASTISFVFIIIVPISVIFIMNLSVINIIRKSRSFRRASTRGRPTQSSLDRTTITLLLVSLMSFLSLFPKSVVELFERIEQENTHSIDWHIGKDRAWYICNALWLLHSAQNFYVIIVTSKEFRRNLRRMCSRNSSDLSVDTSVYAPSGSEMFTISGK